MHTTPRTITLRRKPAPVPTGEPLPLTIRKPKLPDNSGIVKQMTDGLLKLGTDAAAKRRHALLAMAAAQSAPFTVHPAPMPYANSNGEAA